MPTTYGVETFLSPPPSYAVNFADPQRRGDAEIYWVTGVGNALMAFFVGQRLYTKVAFSKRLHLEDGLLILAWMSYITALFHIICAAAAKLSLSVFYLSLAPSTWYRRSVLGTMGILVVYSVVILCCTIFSCSPIPKAWHPNMDGTCLDRTALHIAAVNMDTLTNVMLFMLLMPVVTLHMPPKRRLAGVVIVSVGLLTIITSLIRCAYLPEFLGSEDQTWAMAPSSLWASIEVNLFVICPSMLTLYEFCHETKRRWTGKWRHLSLESLPVTTLSSSASTMTLKSTSYITTIDCSGPRDQCEDWNHQRKKFPFFGTANHHSNGSDLSNLAGLKGSNGSQVSIRLCDKTDLREQRSASALSIRGDRGGDKGILMTTTVTVMHEKGP
ncbi:hypothetical protein PG994_001017 [Apiospora phragmitis]|uniref:Rhodopsin domain-containing protein n=1 Tax=Apiospora phragmitis TaxID=2905665 RepID=A0ABR1WSE2_9PEZI